MTRPATGAEQRIELVDAVRLALELVVLRAATNEELLVGAEKRTTGIEVAGRMMLNDGAALLEAAIAGAGLAKLPSFVARDALASGALVAVLEDRREPDLGVWVVHPAGRAPQPKVRAFVDYLAGSMPARLAALASVTPART